MRTFSSEAQNPPLPPKRPGMGDADRQPLLDQVARLSAEMKSIRATNVELTTEVTTLRAGGSKSGGDVIIGLSGINVRGVSALSHVASLSSTMLLRIVAEGDSLTSEKKSFQANYRELSSEVEALRPLRAAIVALSSENDALRTTNLDITSELNASRAAKGGGGDVLGLLGTTSAKGGGFALSQISSFHSTMLLRIVSEGESLTASSCRRHLDSVLAFFDISGYTKLAESLAKKEGSAGTEKLSSSLSVFFERAIQIINSHGGDVIKFCGDALMCVFPGEGERMHPSSSLPSPAPGDAPPPPPPPPLRLLLRRSTPLRRLRAARTITRGTERRPCAAASRCSVRSKP